MDEILRDERYALLPYCIRSFVCAMVHGMDEHIGPWDVQNVLAFYNGNPARTRNGSIVDTVPFRPTRLVFQNFSGLTSLVDLASARQVAHNLGGVPWTNKISPAVPIDLLMEQTLSPDNETATPSNEEEFARCRERFLFLKWISTTFPNVRVVPPSSNVVHQTALESLSNLTVVKQSSAIVPDVVVGIDSHIAMHNGFGTLAWSVSGIEAECVMLNLPIQFKLPDVIGCRLFGEPPLLATPTDLVLIVTKYLRSQVNLAGCIVEFYGPSVKFLSMADRMSIANMADEYMAVASFFPMDEHTLKHFAKFSTDKSSTFRESEDVLRKYQLISNNCAMPGLYFSDTLELDLGSINVTVSGPHPSCTRTPLSAFPSDFRECLSSIEGERAFKVDDQEKVVTLDFNGAPVKLKHGSLLVASVTNCTNGSHPSTMLTAGLLARNAVNMGLNVSKHIHACVNVGNGLTHTYLKEAGVLEFLTAAGFRCKDFSSHRVKDELPEEWVRLTQQASEELITASMLSNSRGNDCCLQAASKTVARYIASPPLVIAYALAGRADINFEKEPIGLGNNGQPVFLCDLWPQNAETREVQRNIVHPAVVQTVHQRMKSGSTRWFNLPVIVDPLFRWDICQSYVKMMPLLTDKEQKAGQLSIKQPPCFRSLYKAACLLILGDNISADHISPAGSISRNSPAARYLSYIGLLPREFNSYGSRVGNFEVMLRGAFAHKHLVNQMMRSGKPSPKTLYMPTREELDVFDAADRYRSVDIPIIIFAGHDYGCGSARDWAAKCLLPLGVGAVIAQSFDPAHRANLASMGVLPLQFLLGQSVETFSITGMEDFTIKLPQLLTPNQKVEVSINSGLVFQVELRLDSYLEIGYFCHRGIVNYGLARAITPAQQAPVYPPPSES